MNIESQKIVQDDSAITGDDVSDKQVDINKVLWDAHPWIMPWVVRVTNKVWIREIIDTLLFDIEDILGGEPKLRFLRIVDKKVSDKKGHQYIRKLCVFLETEANILAQNNALMLAIDVAINKTLTTCCSCGNELQVSSSAPRPSVLSNEPIEMRCLTCDEPEDCIDNDAPVYVENTCSGVIVFTDRDVNKLERTYKDAQRDQSTRVMSIVRKMREATGKKRLASIPDDWPLYCDGLADTFPNFLEVVGFIRQQFALSAVGDGVLRLPPLLLIGPPGVGKTEFVMTIASGLNTPLQIIDMASAQTATTLSGTESHWSTSAPGTLFNTIAMGDIANPIFLLDELDKSGGDERYNPLSALLQLFEPRQAKNYHDLAVPEVLIDASHVIWIATGNDISMIDKTILDRLTIFNINEPSRDQMQVIITNQYQRFIDTHPSGAFFDDKISQEVVDELSKYHPRGVRKMIERMFGLSALRRSPTLAVTDVSDSNHDGRLIGIGFSATYNPGKNDKNTSYCVELEATPIDWAQAAAKLGYDIVNVHPHAWRFTKPGAVGISDYGSPGEAAKAACIFDGAAFADGACRR